MGVWMLPEPGLLSQRLCAMLWIVPVGRDRQLPILQPRQGWHCPFFCSPCFSLPPSSLWGLTESGAERLLANHCLAVKCISRARFITLA